MAWQGKRPANCWHLTQAAWRSAELENSLAAIGHQEGKVLVASAAQGEQQHEGVSCLSETMQMAGGCCTCGPVPSGLPGLQAAVWELPESGTQYVATKQHSTSCQRERHQVLLSGRLIQRTSGAPPDATCFAGAVLKSHTGQCSCSTGIDSLDSSTKAPATQQHLSWAS